MIGCYAKAQHIQEPVVDLDELEHAHWFTKEEIQIALDKIENNINKI